MFRFVLLLLALSSVTDAYPDGAPEYPEICATMEPGGPHPKLGGAQNDTGPFIIDFEDTTHFIPGKPIKGEIKDSDHAEMFMGFLLRVVDEYGNSVGTLVPEDATAAKTLNCDYPGDSLTQTNNDLKHDVYFFWHPPADTTASFVTFKLTVVKSEYVYWVGITNSLQKASAAWLQSSQSRASTASLTGFSALMAIGLALVLVRRR